MAGYFITRGILTEYYGRYRGRFAPSPTGPLHAGSLLTAVASYLEARTHGGQWLLRVEDLDPPREPSGASATILYALEAFGFEWDGPVVYQSQRHHLYQQALEQLIDEGYAFACACTRKSIATVARAGLDGPIYPGTCRVGLPYLQVRQFPVEWGGRPTDQSLQIVGDYQGVASARAWRLRVPCQTMGFCDGVQGEYQQNLAEDIGDFILKRADGFWAYQLAVVVDDAEQGITDVVRGMDLLVSTPRQIWLQSCLQLAHPRYIHLPLLVNAAGEKLSKQTQAPAIDTINVLAQLRQVLLWLGQQPDPGCQTLPELWQWAYENWRLDRVPARSILV